MGRSNGRDLSVCVFATLWLEENSYTAAGSCASINTPTLLHNLLYNDLLHEECNAAMMPHNGSLTQAVVSLSMSKAHSGMLGFGFIYVWYDLL